jgi:hypothetical protein
MNPLLLQPLSPQLASDISSLRLDPSSAAASSPHSLLGSESTSHPNPTGALDHQKPEPRQVQEHVITPTDQAPPPSPAHDDGTMLVSASGLVSSNDPKIHNLYVPVRLWYEAADESEVCLVASTCRKAEAHLRNIYAALCGKQGTGGLQLISVVPISATTGLECHERTLILDEEPTQFSWFRETVSTEYRMQRKELLKMGRATAAGIWGGAILNFRVKPSRYTLPVQEIVEAE